MSHLHSFLQRKNTMPFVHHPYIEHPKILIGNIVPAVVSQITEFPPTSLCVACIFLDTSRATHKDIHLQSIIHKTQLEAKFIPLLLTRNAEYDELCSGSYSSVPLHQTIQGSSKIWYRQQTILRIQKHTHFLG